MTWLRGPSSTSEVTSSPRWAGRQWRKIASGLACASKLVVDLVGGEDTAPRFGLVLLAHARPDVGIDDVGAVDRLLGIVFDDQGNAGKPGREPRLEIGRKLVARRRGQHEMDAEQGRGHRQRPGDVVAVADEHQLLAGERPAQLLDRHEIGHGLAGMRGVGKGVDDRDRRGRGQLFDGGVRKGADGQGVDVLAQDPGEVDDALADAQPHVLAVAGRWRFPPAERSPPRS